MATTSIGEGTATAGVVKDAGDDPDVTHGALILATVRRCPAGEGLRFVAGPGVGTVMDPRTGRWLDETRFTIEAIDWLSADDKKKIFEDNAKKLFNLKVPEKAVV